MQKDIQKSKGETNQQKFENQPFTDKPSVSETTGHKLKEVGHDINANLKENVGVGFGNYSSQEDRQRSGLNEQKFEEKKEQLIEETKNIKEKIIEFTEPIGHKIQEVVHNVNATLKQNVGIGVGNYSSEVDQQISQEHKEKYDEKIQPVKQKVEAVKQQVEAKKDEIKCTLEEKKEVLVEKAHEGTTGLYTHRIEEVAHIVNAKLKETIGIGIGDYSSDVDRQKAEEHWEEYMERVKETSKVEVSDSNPIVHKIKEVAHNVNANLKELIGVGVGNYSSEVDRELSQIHHQKYEEMKQTTNTAESAELSGSSTPSKSFEKAKEKLEGKLFPKAELRDDPTPSFISSPKKEADEKEKEEKKF